MKTDSKSRYCFLRRQGLSDDEARDVIDGRKTIMEVMSK